MKKRMPLLLLLFAVVLGLGVLSTSNDRPENLQRTYSPDDKSAFGTYIFKKHLNEVFPRAEIEVKEVPLTDYYDKLISANPPQAFIQIKENPGMDSSDIKRLLDFAHKGNTLFLVSEYFGDHLLSKLDLWQETDFSTDSLYITHLHSTATINTGSRFSRLHHYFTTDSAFKGSILSINQTGKAVFVEVPWGKGKIFLHLHPEVYANLTLLQNTGFNYAYATFNYFEADKIIWNEYHGLAMQAEARTPLKYILRSPALRWAWMCLMLIVILYFFVQSKRKQRAMDPPPEIENSNIEFAETMGRLYLQQKSFSKIAQKVVSHLKRYIYEEYRFNWNRETEDLLAKKTGFDIKKLEKMRVIGSLASSLSGIDENQLRQLNTLSEEFYNHINNGRNKR